MSYLDCYARSEGEKGYLDGFPEATFEIDLPEPKLTKVLKNLSVYFAELREVEKTNGQAIQRLSMMADCLDGSSGVPRSKGPGIISRLENQ